MENEFKETLTKKLIKANKNYENTNKKEIDFLIETIPELLPYFMDKWISGDNFGPLKFKGEKLIHSTISWNERQDYLSYEGYCLISPTSLGVIENVALTEFKKNIFSDSSNNMEYRYSSPIIEAIRESFGKEIVDNIRNSNSELIKQHENKKKDFEFTDMEQTVIRRYLSLKRILDLDDDGSNKKKDWFYYLERMGIDKSKTFNLNNHINYILLREDLQIVPHLTSKLIIYYPSICVNKEIQSIIKKLMIVNKNMDDKLGILKTALDSEKDFYSKFNYQKTISVVEAINNEVNLRNLCTLHEFEKYNINIKNISNS